MGSWGYFNRPTEPLARKDAEVEAYWLALEERMEWDARPTYEEMMEMDDNAVGEE